ncbi:MAG: hypothetical protein HY741_04735 [Chloroflexi bacterium]|nr:hypothetical protein [Chloroflexota bacterium]
MKSSLILTLILAVVIVGILLLVYVVNQADAAPLPQSKIESIAISHARSVGLKGAATIRQSKLMTRDEFNSLLDPFSSQGSDQTKVWIVDIGGNVTVQHPMNEKGEIPSTEFSNIWVLLDKKGHVLGWGSKSPGHELNLDAPVRRIESWPSPAAAK